MVDAVTAHRERLARLVRPKDFQREYRHLFRTETALRYHLAQRQDNGLISSGAVVETPLGLFIDAESFVDWVFSRHATQAR